MTFSFSISVLIPIDDFVGQSVDKHLPGGPKMTTTSTSTTSVCIMFAICVYARIIFIKLHINCKTAHLYCLNNVNIFIAINYSQFKCAHSFETIFIILSEPQCFLLADCESNSVHR